MRVLGMADGQTSGACVVEDGVIVAAVNEERIVRKKQARGFPRASIAEVLRLSGTRPEDLGAVASSDLRLKLREEIDDWPGWFEARDEGRGGINDVFFRAASAFGGVFPFIPGARSAYYGLRWPVYHRRRQRIPEILRQDFGITAPVQFFHHHFAHAASAYLTSGFKDALVVTLDGGGDGDCSHVYSVKDGVFEKINAVSSYNSLGNYYAYITAICGYKAKRHEGKITGLAAQGQPLYQKFLESLIGCEHGQLVNRGRVLFKRAAKKIEAGLPRGWSHKDLAASIQVVSENAVKAYVSHWLKETGHRNVALAGGLFANVRINEEILQLDGVDSISVHPGMSDEGLFVGAALAADHAKAQSEGRSYEPRNLPHVYLGSDIEEDACRKALESADVQFEKPEGVAQNVAKLLHEGMVVARAAGKMEYGPRALGNRSILYQPGDPSVNDWLNTLLRRTEFMPFAPACMFEAADQLFVNSEGGKDTARFMTVTFHCTPWAEDKCAGVVHVDSTARPQLVRREDNPAYYEIIEEYSKLSGIPAVINTSFNIHEEPIVRTAEDAVRAFLDSSLDYLQLGSFVAKGPKGSSEARAAWEKERSAAVAAGR